jgi:hypothetical protein
VTGSLYEVRWHVVLGYAVLPPFIALTRLPVALLHAPQCHTPRPASIHTRSLTLPHALGHTYSPTHDHAGSHCWLRMLEGGLEEVWSLSRHCSSRLFSRPPFLLFLCGVCHDIVKNVSPCFHLCPNFLPTCSLGITSCLPSTQTPTPVTSVSQLQSRLSSRVFSSFRAFFDTGSL